MQFPLETRATAVDRGRRTEGATLRWAARIVLALVWLLAIETAFARPPYIKAWKNRYPDSSSLANFVEAGTQACFLCHASNDTPPPDGGRLLHGSWNSYGWSLRRMVVSGSSIEEAFAAVESLDADFDPAGTSNLEEIRADAQPGWTYGPHNVTHSMGGDTREDTLPPKQYLGDLDPPGIPYCATVPNSTGARAVLWTSGSSVAEENVFTLHAAPVPDDTGVFFFGAGRQDVPFGRGRLCVGGKLSRLPTVQGRGNAMALEVDLEEHPAAFVAGSTWYFQTWYADRAAGPPFFNTSNALAITFR